MGGGALGVLERKVLLECNPLLFYVMHLERENECSKFRGLREDEFRATPMVS